MAIYRKLDTRELALGARPDIDHFEDILEMVGDLVPAGTVSLFVVLDDRKKVAVLRVIQHLGERARSRIRILEHRLDECSRMFCDVVPQSLAWGSYPEFPDN